MQATTLQPFTPSPTETSTPVIAIDQLNHHFGEGNLRKQVLFDINLEIRSGEIVIMTGPSGSGKPQPTQYPN